MPGRRGRSPSGRPVATSASIGRWCATRRVGPRPRQGGNQAGSIDRSNTFANARAESSGAPALAFYRNRYYDQLTGRFLNEDPIGVAGGLNLYGFVGNNPASFTDPFGLCPPEDPSTFADCAPGTSGWYAHRLATGEGNAALNMVGGVLATCGESLACNATLFAGGVAAGAVRMLAGRGAVAGAGAAVGAAEIPGAAGQITGFTRHGMNQVINRGVRPGDMLQAVRSAAPLRLVDDAGRVSFRYIGEKATVVLNEAGKVITAW